MAQAQHNTFGAVLVRQGGVAQGTGIALSRTYGTGSVQQCFGSVQAAGRGYGNALLGRIQSGNGTARVARQGNGTAVYGLAQFRMETLCIQAVESSKPSQMAEGQR